MSHPLLFSVQAQTDRQMAGRKAERIEFPLFNEDGVQIGVSYGYRFGGASEDIDALLGARALQIAAE